MEKKYAVTAALVVVALVLAGWGIWALNVALSAPKGQGDAEIMKNSAENWTAAQAKFEDMYQDVVEADEKLAIHANPDPDDKTAVQTYKGVQSACITARGDYNAEANKFMAEEFRRTNLPAQIDNTNPATDCK